MTPEERQRFDELCAQLKTEKDQNRFHALIRELNELVKVKERRLQGPGQPKSS